MLRIQIYKNKNIENEKPYRCELIKDEKVLTNVYCNGFFEGIPKLKKYADEHGLKDEIKKVNYKFMF